jgi:hypothetical protein
MSVPISKFRVRITPHVEAKLANAPLDRLPTCAIRDNYTRQKTKRPYKVQGQNGVVLHCNPCSTGVEVVDAEIPHAAPESCIEHAAIGLKDTTFDERRLKPASVACPHRAGTRQRVEAMARRAQRGEHLYHELDNPDIVPPAYQKADSVFSWRELAKIRPLSQLRSMRDE